MYEKYFLIPIVHLENNSIIFLTTKSPKDFLLRGFILLNATTIKEVLLS